MRENEKLIQFVYHRGELLYERGEEDQTSYYLGAGIEASQIGQKVYYYYQDEQLSTALITDDIGNIQNHYQYDAFGWELEKTEYTSNRIRYTGQMYDAQTEQYYLRARYYNPFIGRFLQEDAYHGDSLNLYAYCHNNPVMYFDPIGYAKKYTVDEVVAALQTDSNGNKYILNKEHDTAYKTNTLSPDNYQGALHSHHGLQREWADEILKPYGYDGGLAPTITLETNRGGVKNTPHSNISSQQITYNNKNGIHSGTLEERLILGAQQQLNAGISKEVVMQDLENNYKMIDKLNQISADKIEAGDLPELTYSRDNIENSLKNNEQIKQKNC